MITRIGGEVYENQPKYDFVVFESLDIDEDYKDSEYKDKTLVHQQYIFDTFWFLIELGPSKYTPEFRESRNEIGRREIN